LSSSNAAPLKPVKSTGLHIGDAAPGVAKVDPIIIADNVTRQFGGLKAVDVEHLEIPRNAITALIGPNGAGKTTLFNLLTGFDKPDTGTWVFDGKQLNGVPAFKVARMGQVRTFQLTKALGLLTVLENMKLGGGDRGARARYPRAIQARHQEGRLRGESVRRTAQAARNGQGPDERTQARHAR
jgi:neutral amino acid transport system ATP-binding protein